MKKTLGIFCLLVVICLYTALMNSKFLTAYNLENLIRRTALFGIISIGVAFVIITSGIDLSVGSVVGLIGVILPWLLAKAWGVVPALLVVLMVSVWIGLLHGLLITKLRLQPFIVTLCGLLFYRGLARYIADDTTQGFGTGYQGLKYLASGKVGLPLIEGFAIPVPFLIFGGIAVVSALFLNHTIFGRYLMALGNNEKAALYSGINTDRMVIAAYVVCSFLAGFGGVLFALDVNSVQPSNHGNSYELYAIAAAVLGGCSLRGGEGTILGVVIGTAVMRVLYTSIILLGISTQIEYCIIGAVILGGVVTDELVKRFEAKRRALAQAREA